MFIHCFFQPQTMLRAIRVHHKNSCKFIVLQSLYFTSQILLCKIACLYDLQRQGIYGDFYKFSYSYPIFCIISVPEVSLKFDHDISPSPFLPYPQRIFPWNPLEYTRCENEGPICPSKFWGIQEVQGAWVWCGLPPKNIFEVSRGIFD